MRRHHRMAPGWSRGVILAVCSFLLQGGCSRADRQPPGQDHPLTIEVLQLQGLRRALRVYRPARLPDRPALVVALHGSGGNGERFRRLTDKAFERLADEHGFVVAYPDALGGQWNDCRAATPYHRAIAGVDEIAFLHAVIEHVQDRVGSDLSAVFAVGYSNGGHLVYRLALEAAADFAALAVIGAHLPVSEQLDCRSSGAPVSILIASGTDDPINPWSGGLVRVAGGEAFGQVRSAVETAEFFRELARTPDEPVINRHPDRDRNDGTRVETRRWLAAGGSEVVLMVVHGGGHSLPHPTASFPIEIVGRTSRDLNGAGEIWTFFQRHMKNE